MDDDPLPRFLRLILIVLMGTGGLAALLGWFGHADGSMLFVLVRMGSLIAIPVGGLILLAIFAVLARDGWRIGSALTGGARWLARGAAPLGLVLALASLVFLPGPFGSLHRQHLLSENRATFEYAMRQDASKVTLSNGETAYVSRERADLYYFSLAGIGDNGQGFVHDPSGQVAQARGWTSGEPRRLTAPDEVKKLFGGDMLDCDPVSGDWFYCTFT